MYVCGEREREDLYVYLDTDNPRKMGGGGGKRVRGGTGGGRRSVRGEIFNRF